MPRQLHRLSARRVEMLKKPGWHADGGGLYLRIQAGGRRSWVVVDAKGGKRTERGLGAYPDVSLAEAREARNGPEPGSKAAPLFGDWASSYIDGIEAGFKNEVHRKQWRSTIEQHAKALRNMRVDAITTDDVVAVLRPIWTSKNETASRLRGRIERILDAAAAAGLRDSDKRNPATWKGHLEHFLPKRPKKSQRGHHEAVPWRDMPAFWTTLAARRDSTSVQALRFTILTAARTGEVIGARVREFNLDHMALPIAADANPYLAPIWTVPAGRMKMGFEHQVPLSPAAVTIIRTMTLGLGPDDFVFPGLKPGASLSNMAMLMLLQDDMKRSETVHGFRSSFRDWSGEATDFPRELAEMSLAHVVGDASENAYRRERAREKRRPLMEAWSEYLRG